VLKTKDSLVKDILKRWWYVLPDWPPKDFDYNTALRSKKLKRIDLAVWKMHKDEDEDGFKKVFEITGFPGMYKTENGELFDIRPEEGRPSNKYLSSKTEKDLS